MKILIISSYLPYPLFSGGHVRLYNLLKILGKKHEFTLVCEKRPNQTQEDIDAVKKLCTQVITVERKKQWSFINILKTGFSPYPFLLTGHSHAAFKDAIERTLAKKTFDLIHVETSYVFQNVPHTLLPTVLVEHNIEHLVYKRYAHRAPVLLRGLLYTDVFKLRFWEERFWKKATKIVVVSKEEQGYINRPDVAIVPNGVDTKGFSMSDIEEKIKREKKTVLFIGNFKWMQNRDSASFILKEIWPIIKIKNQSFDSAQDRHSKIKIIMWIVGKHIPESIKNLTTDQDVIFDENAPKETPEIFSKADVLLSPVRVGGGTSYKILEAMASGVPVITTSLGIEGIDATHNTEVLIADSKEELALALDRVLSNQQLYISLAENARRLVEKKYDWQRIAQTLEDVYKSVI